MNFGNATANQPLAHINSNFEKLYSKHILIPHAHIFVGAGCMQMQVALIRN